MKPHAFANEVGSPERPLVAVPGLISVVIPDFGCDAAEMPVSPATSRRAMTTQHLIAILSRVYDDDVYPFLTHRGFGYRVLDVALAIVNAIVLGALVFLIAMIAWTRPARRLGGWLWRGRPVKPAHVLVLAAATVVVICGSYAVALLISLAVCIGCLVSGSLGIALFWLSQRCRQPMTKARFCPGPGTG